MAGIILLALLTTTNQNLLTMIKKITTTLIAVLAIAFSSCEKIKDSIKANVPVTIEDITFTLPPSSDVETFSQDFSMALNIDSLIKDVNSSLGAGNIKAAYVESIVLSIDEDSRYEDDNFTALEELNAALASDSKPAFTNIASIGNTPEKFVLDMYTLSDQDIKGYLTGDRVTFRFNGKMKRATTQTLNCSATIKLKITAGLD